MSLADFDRLRNEDPTAALAGYARVVAEIDSADEDRLTWICRQDLRAQPEVESLLLRAWRGGGDAGLCLA